MIGQTETKRFWEGVPAKELRAAGQTLVVQLGSEDLVKSAALLDPASGAWEGLCLAYTMGDDGIEGMEDDTVEISVEEDGAPLAELALPQAGGVKVVDSGVSLLFWNRSGKAVAVDGDLVKPGDYLLLPAPTGEELDQALQAYLRTGGGAGC